LTDRKSTVIRFQHQVIAFSDGRCSKEDVVNRNSHTYLASQEAAARPGWAACAIPCVSTEMRRGFAVLKSLDTQILPSLEVR